jgi:tetratricopeptide (TPR) repeat protein
MRQGLAELQEIPAPLGKPYFVALLVDVLLDSEEPNEAGKPLADALEVVRRNGNRAHAAELQRLAGLVHVTNGRIDEAEQAFDRSMVISREQRALALELRTAVSLASLLGLQGRFAAASDVLQPVVARFDGRRTTQDLEQAHELLDLLSKIRDA